ncbi:MAG: hypothetical protein WAV51_04450 [Microgenomates group bacterium]
MKKEETQETCCQEKSVCKPRCHHLGGQPCSIYGLGVIGALFYFLQNATTFGAVMIGIGKSIFWPAILMFKLLTYLQL